jgi:hypothetical protein
MIYFNNYFYYEYTSQIHLDVGIIYLFFTFLIDLNGQN